MSYRRCAASAKRKLARNGDGGKLRPGLGRIVGKPEVIGEPSGQVLLSRETRQVGAGTDLSGYSVSQNLTFKALGEHVFCDVATPRHVTIAVWTS